MSLLLLYTSVLTNPAYRQVFGTRQTQVPAIAKGPSASTSTMGRLMQQRRQREIRDPDITELD